MIALPKATLSAATWVVLILSLALPAGATAQAPSAELVSATERFELFSTPRANLFHFLIAWASADADEWPPYAPPIRERQNWRQLLSADEAPVWTAAAEAFAATRNRSLLFDEGILALRDWAAGVGTRSAIPEADQAVAEAIETALPVYTRHWWPRHDARNRAWIDALLPDLALTENAVIPLLEASYGGTWPNDMVPVDVVFYANPVGAYSTGGRITISGADRNNAMPQGLELVYHEASHTDNLEGPLREAVSAAFREVGGEAPDRLWHDFIFYTSGEATRIVFEQNGRPGYEHYGEGGVYSRGARWRVELPAFEEHWKPFVRSTSNEANARRNAMESIARVMLAAQQR